MVVEILIAHDWALEALGEESCDGMFGEFLIPGWSP